MYRYIPAALLIAGTFYVRHHNQTSRFEKILFPGVGSSDRWKDDLYAQGTVSWVILACLAGLFLAIAIVTTVMDYRRANKNK